MSRLYVIHDSRGERRLDESGLPLRVGGVEAGDVAVPGVSAGAVVAHIALFEGHAFIQAADDAPPLFHNHERLSESKWLKSGDRVEAGAAVVTWTVKGDQVFIQVQERPAAPELTPPREPPPGAPSRYRAVPEAGDAGASRSGRRWLRNLLLALFLLLVLAVAFVLGATPVALRITPEPATRAFTGTLPPLPVGERLLVWPGQYTLRAGREGYRPLEQRVAISGKEFRELRFELEELPGRVSVAVDPAVPFELFVDAVLTHTDAGDVAEVGRGTRRLRVETERYLPAERDLEVAGLGQSQEVIFILQPAWAEVRIASRPAGAAVTVDGEVVGTTPLNRELMQGAHGIGLTLDGYKPVTLQREITAGSNVDLGEIELLPVDGRLALVSSPDAATVSVDREFHGTTPITLALSSGVEHEVRLTKSGYQASEQRVTLSADEERELVVELAPEYGIVFVTARPADASLVLDGKPVGRATRRLRLTTGEHTLEFHKPGYATKRITVTPQAGVSRNLDVALEATAREKAVAERPAEETSAGKSIVPEKSAPERAAGIPATLQTATGGKLLLVRPSGSFRMGASRREAGRRANESARLVQLTRPFYLGVNEVTNAEFRGFRPSHNSGTGEGAALNHDDHPVVNVSWDDAARYCNWLSARDGLPAAYREEGGGMVPVTPATTGYRLPTEAEWAFAARVHGRAAKARYPWTGSYPPVSAAGNFADARIADTLADVVPGYDDGYRGTAPVGSYPPLPGGFHDLGGNVAEWTNDFYAVYPGEAERLVSDPRGPASGGHHVVRDSSWRKGSITELRLSYRDYSRTPRDDLGFRVARYAE